MDCDRHRPGPEGRDRAVRRDDRRSVSECQENRAKPIASVRSAPSLYAHGSVRGVRGYTASEKRYCPLQPGSSGECWLKTATDELTRYLQDLGFQVFYFGGNELK